MILVAVVGLVTSYFGSMLAWITWGHFDLEGYWQNRRYEHGRHLDARQREAAQHHH